MSTTYASELDRVDRAVARSVYILKTLHVVIPLFVAGNLALSKHFEDATTAMDMVAYCIATILCGTIFLPLLLWPLGTSTFTEAGAHFVQRFGYACNLPYASDKAVVHHVLESIGVAPSVPGDNVHVQLRIERPSLDADPHLFLSLICGQDIPLDDEAHALLFLMAFPGGRRLAKDGIICTVAVSNLRPSAHARIRFAAAQARAAAHVSPASTFVLNKNPSQSPSFRWGSRRSFFGS